jgi:hypothetical protein
MKLLNNKVFMILLVILSGYGYIISCTHDNSIAPPPVVSGTKYTPGTGVFLPGAMTPEIQMNGSWIKRIQM